MLSLKNNAVSGKTGLPLWYIKLYILTAHAQYKARENVVYKLQVCTITSCLTDWRAGAH